MQESITLALDARTIHRCVRRGTGKNLIDLYRHVLQLRPQWQVIGYHRGPDSSDHVLHSTGVYRPRVIEMPGDRFNWWQRWRLPLAAWRDGADLLHCPANDAPQWQPVPVLLTVHDLLLFTHGTPDQARRFERSVRQAVSRGTIIITPSRYTADQLAERFGADDGQIVVNHWAADSAMRYVADETLQRLVTSRYGVTGPFVLHFGAAEARKNTAAVVEAFANVPSADRRDWSLLIIGLEDETFRRQVERQAEQLGAADAVRAHGFAPESDMAPLLSAAQVLAYPSLAEGFGLPILDAWAAHTAVLCSNTTSLAEVAGDAAMLVDPTDTEAISSGLQQLIKDETLRRRLIERGTKRLARFTWQATAERFIGAVELAQQRSERFSRKATRRAAA